MHLKESKQYQAEKDHLMRNEGTHPANRSFVDTLKRMAHEKYDENTGMPYHKGEKASDEESSRWSGKRHFESDPDL